MRHTLGQMQVYTIAGDVQGCELPVFSSEGAARGFLISQPEERGWTPRPTSVGELISVLYGPCARVGFVAVDPSAPGGGASPAAVRRSSFLDLLLGSGRTPKAVL